MGLSLELQCLLQTFLSQNALSEINLRAVVGQLLHQGPSDVSRADMLQEVDRLNEEIANLDLEIRRTILQVDCSDVWVLCNTTSDAITQLATVHNANEIGFFKNLLTCMFVKNNTHRSEIFAVPTMEALNEAQEAKLSKSQAQTALKKFVAESWLSKSPSGFYTLTARSLVELQGYLKDNFGDPADEQSALRTCHACKEYLIMGVRCAELSCSCRLHFKCYDGFFKNSSTQCPLCHTGTWEANNLTHVGERAARPAENGQEQTSDDD